MEHDVETAKNGDGELAVLVGGALALGLGAAATWAIGKFFGRAEAVEEREGSDPTTMEGVQRYLQY
jgi:hypothetical protein